MKPNSPLKDLISDRYQLRWASNMTSKATWYAAGSSSRGERINIPHLHFQSVTLATILNHVSPWTEVEQSLRKADRKDCLHYHKGTKKQWLIYYTNKALIILEKAEIWDTATSWMHYFLFSVINLQASIFHVNAHPLDGIVPARTTFNSHKLVRKSTGV